jgi:hypothetical protein
LGCQWFGFGGHVIDASGAPVSGVTVRIWADGWEGTSAVTTASGEYELFMNDQPLQGQWQVQLYQGETAVSEVVTVESQADCEATLIRVDWQRGDQDV